MSLLPLFSSLCHSCHGHRTREGRHAVRQRWCSWYFWAFGGMIFILVYCTAGISGGHINPAVTFGLLVARRVSSLLRAVAYMVAQCLGGLCGVGLVKALMKHYYLTHGGGANWVAPDYSKAEIVCTFLLVYTVFSATGAKRSARDSHVPVSAPLPIGFAVFMVHLATIPISLLLGLGSGSTLLGALLLQ